MKDSLERGGKSFRHSSESEFPQVNEYESRINPFASFAIIGAEGKTGRFYTDCFTIIPNGPDIQAVISSIEKTNTTANQLRNLLPEQVHTSVKTLLTSDTPPQALLLATPALDNQILADIAEYATSPLIVILPQTKVDTVPRVKEAFGNNANIRIIRASNFTPVVEKNGNVDYVDSKKRIALSIIPEQDENETLFSLKDFDALKRVERQFQNAGFSVTIVDDYRSMEYTKLFYSLIGSTTEVTGLTIAQTLKDSQLMQLEIRAIRDRLALLKKANIPLADMPWIKPLVQLASLAPYKLAESGVYANLIADAAFNDNYSFEPEENNQQSDRAAKSTYHKGFIELGDGIQSPVDHAISLVLQSNIAYEGKSLVDKRKLLFDTFRAKADATSSDRNPLATTAMRVLAISMVNEIAVQKQEVVEQIADAVKRGKWVVIAPPHGSHLDHFALWESIRKLDPTLTDRIKIISGFKFQDGIMTKILENAISRHTIVTVSKSSQDEERFIANIVNPKSLKALYKEMRFKEGKPGGILIVYPEGTRSRDNGKIQEGIAAATWFLKHPNVEHIIPVGITNTYKIVPPGKLPHFFSGTPVEVTFGDPTSYETLKNRASTIVSENPNSNEEEAITSVLMTEITHLNPEREGFYKIKDE